MRYLSLSVLFAGLLYAQNVDTLKSLKFREIGPANMGGRIDDFTVVESNTNIVYAATASGGLWAYTWARAMARFRPPLRTSL